MSKEIQANQYYIHYSYIPGYYYLYKTLEEWLASRIFRQDRSRVICASNEYAFRRRFELTDTSKNYNDIDASSLQFPFLNYWPQNSGWQPDTRVAGNPAPLVYLGIYEGNTKIRAASGSLDIPITLYFDREDDARMAYEKLLFFTYNEHNYATDIGFNGEILRLPMILSLQNLRFNPRFNETDWLKQNRIYTITLNILMRSYIIYPPEQPDWDVNVDSLGLLPDGSQYDDGSETYYPVEKVILLDQFFREDLTVEGTFNESGILLNQFSISEVTEDSVVINWEIENIDDVDKMEIRYDNSKDYIEIDPSLKTYQITGLESNSKYNLYIIIYSKKGTSKRIGASFETLGSDSPQEDVTTAPLNSLVGISF